MKKIVIIGIVAAIALIIGLSGCAMEKTYSYESSGYCQEVVTSDMDLQNYLLDAGYSVGACPTDSQLGKCSYTLDYPTQLGTTESFTVSAVYYEGAYFQDAASAEAACNFLAGTWTAQ